MGQDHTPQTVGPFSLEAFVVAALRRWKDPELGWAGEVTLVFPGSGGSISHLREERRTQFDVTSGYGWDHVQFGFKKVTYQHGRGHMLIESRVIRPEAGVCGSPIPLNPGSVVPQAEE